MASEYPFGAKVSAFDPKDISVTVRFSKVQNIKSNVQNSVLMDFSSFPSVVGVSWAASSELCAALSESYEFTKNNARPARQQCSAGTKLQIFYCPSERRCGDMQHYAAVTRNLQLNKYLCILAIKHESPLSKVPIYIPGVARLQCRVQWLQLQTKVHTKVCNHS